MTKYSNRKSVFFLIIFLLLGCNASSRTQTQELRTAYEKFETTYMQAQLTLDTTALPQVATGEALRLSTASVEQRMDFPDIRVAKEAKVGLKFRVLEYEDTHALVETNVTYRNFTQDPNTGERTYSSDYSRWYSVRAEMVKESGIWKVAQARAEEWDW